MNTLISFSYTNISSLSLYLGEPPTDNLLCLCWRCSRNTEGLLKRTNLFQLIGYRKKALSSILSGRTARNL